MRHFTFLLVLCFCATALAVDVGLSPPRAELVVGRGATTTTTALVLTTGSAEQRILAATSDWTLDPGGNLTFLDPGSTSFSNARWLDLDSDDFTLGPASSREVRITVSVPDTPETSGTYHSMVFFTVAPLEDLRQGVGVATTTRVGLTVYVTVAGTERDGSELVDMYQSGERTIAAVVLNTGNTVMRLGGVVEIRDEAGDVVRRLDVPDVPVLRESERELAFALPDDLPSGFYVALALIEDSRGGVLAGELPFDLP